MQLASLLPPSKRRKESNGGGDNSRSATAFRKGSEMRKAGKTYEEMVNALRSDPDTAAWCREKGDLAGGRELRRIWACMTRPLFPLTIFTRTCRLKNISTCRHGGCSQPAALMRAFHPSRC